MKKVLPIITIAAFVTACNTNPRVITDTAKAPDTDTVGFAQFKAWKAQQELQAANTSVIPNSEPANVEAVKEKTVVYTPVRRTYSRTSAPSRAYEAYESGTLSSESSNTAQAPVKKGWSKAAKGAVIGAVTGAAAGAIINKKNRAVGAVIGGVLGGGVGYGVGRHMDKRDGRY